MQNARFRRHIRVLDPNEDIFSRVACAASTARHEQAIETALSLSSLAILALERPVVGSYWLPAVLSRLQALANRLGGEELSFSDFTPAEVIRFFECWLALEDQEDERIAIRAAHDAVLIGRVQTGATAGTNETEPPPDTEFDSAPNWFSKVSIDIGHEESRSYLYYNDDGGDDREVVVDKPSRLAQDMQGNHYILDKGGIGIIVPPGWSEITVKPQEGQFAFAR